MPEAGGFIWYELMTPDPAASKAFYDTVVGWDIGTDSVAPDIEYRMIQRSDGGNAGGVLTLTEDMRANGARPMWLGYIHDTDVDARVAAAEADGGTVLMRPWDQPEVGRLALLTGPEGAPFYIMKPIPPDGNPDAASDVFAYDKAQHVRWNELSSSDQDRSIEFYTRQFGWEQKDTMPMGEMGEYKFLYRGEGMIGAVMRKQPQTPASLWLFYIGVDDIDRAAEAVTTGGGTILHGPIEIPGGEFSLVGADPQGAAFGLVGPRKS